VADAEPATDELAADVQVAEEPAAPEPTETDLPKPNRRRPQPRKKPVASNTPAENTDLAPADANTPAADPVDPTAAEQDSTTQENVPAAIVAPVADNSTPEITPAANSGAPAVPSPASTAPKVNYAANLAAPHLVVVAYPKNHAAFKDILTKMMAYNAKYNLVDKLAVDSTGFNGTTNFLIIKEFDAGKKAVSYATKQKAPQSPLSKIRGIEFTTFAITSENLLVLMKEGKLEDYLTFYKNSYF